jgi:hypothetical protein
MDVMMFAGDTAPRLLDNTVLRLVAYGASVCIFFDYSMHSQRAKY